MKSIVKQVETLKKMENDVNDSSPLNSDLFLGKSSRGYQLKSISDNEKQLYGPNQKTENDIKNYYFSK